MNIITLRRILTCTLLSILLAGCGTTASQMKANNESFAAVCARWGEENHRQHQAFGERVYDKDFDSVFSAVVTAFSDSGLAVKNMERQSGYILAEGPSPLPASQARKLAQESCDEVNKVCSLKYLPTPGNNTISVTITVILMGEHKAKMKMRIVNTDIHADPRAERHFESYPPTLEAEYQFIWRALEKQIFLDENLDKLKK